jgi:hypothetical protein
MCPERNVGFTWVVLFWKAHEPRPSCSVFLWRNHTLCKSHHVLPVLGWRKFAGYNRLMLLLCQRRRLQSSLVQYLWHYVSTDEEVLLVNIPSQMEVSFVVHKEIFACSWIILIHPEKFISVLHLVPRVASQPEYCVGTRQSPFEVLCKRTNG